MLQLEEEVSLKADTQKPSLGIGAVKLAETCAKPVAETRIVICATTNIVAFVTFVTCAFSVWQLDYKRVLWLLRVRLCVLHRCAGVYTEYTQLNVSAVCQADKHRWSSACSLFNSVPPVENILPNICFRTDFNKAVSDFAITLGIHLCVCVWTGVPPCVFVLVGECSCLQRRVCVRAPCYARTVNTESSTSGCDGINLHLL